MPQTGPRLKKIRRFGTQLPGLTRKAPRWKEYPPGVHGPGPRRKKKSEYRVRLEEKQKVRANYGVSERQLRKYFRRASRTTGVTGDALLSLLERRMDNVVFRLGFAPTIPAARQLVVHGHIRVDGKKMDRPAYETSNGEVISVSVRGRKIPWVQEQADRGPELRLPSYLQSDSNDKFTGRVMGVPVKDDASLVVDAAAIVEFYAR
jgi:small subunit ribosomal protein S4